MQSPLYRGGHIVANNAGWACLLGDSASQSEKGRPRRAGADDEGIVCYYLLTVNANSHALLHLNSPPGSEKNMHAHLE